MIGFSLTRRRIDHLISCVDELLNRQINEIIHNPSFQALEAAWRGVYLLARHAGSRSGVKLKLLDLNWNTLARDVEGASEFDQTELFNFIYNLEFGMPGGEPFGLIVADYVLGPGVKNGFDVVSVLTQVSTIAAAAFCPFIAEAAPSILGLCDFNELKHAPNLKVSIQDSSHRRWNRLREHEDTRFVGLVGPRILMRKPYSINSRDRINQFPFREMIRMEDQHLLWGNGAFAFALVIIRCYLETGWFSDIRGIKYDGKGGGALSALDIEPYDDLLESNSLSAQPPVSIRLSSSQEQHFRDNGLIPLAPTYLSPTLVFNSNASLHLPSQKQNENTRLNAMLQYVLCVSRFCQYLKVIMRNEIGSSMSADRLSNIIEKFLFEYTSATISSDLDFCSRYPLRAASVNIHEYPGHQDKYVCRVHIQPRTQIFDVSTVFQIIFENPGLQEKIFL